MPKIEGFGNLTELLGYESDMQWERVYDRDNFFIARLMHPVLFDPDITIKRGNMSGQGNGLPIWATSFAEREGLEPDKYCREFYISAEESRLSKPKTTANQPLRIENELMVVGHNEDDITHALIQRWYVDEERVGYIAIGECAWFLYGIGFNTKAFGITSKGVDMYGYDHSPKGLPTSIVNPEILNRLFSANTLLNNPLLHLKLTTLPDNRVARELPSWEEVLTELETAA